MISGLIKNVFIFAIVYPIMCAALANVCLDLNDILSLNWMPATLLQKVGADDYVNVSNKTITGIDSRMGVLDGTIDDALNTMTFHRTMLNQYHCRHYVANQILSEMSKTSFNRRIGDPDQENIEAEIMQKENTKSSLLLDQGPASYEEWLRKSATLNDIYRHHHSINNLKDNGIHSSKTNVVNVDKNPQISTKFDHEYHGGPALSDYIANDAGSHIYDKHPYLVHPSIYHSSQVEKPDTKSDKLADIFEIALTALAYLSFGMFIVHLMMCISAVGNNQNTTTNNRIVAVNLGPAELNADGYEPHNTESSLESEEFKYRSINKPETSTTTTAEKPNELARKILSIFNSALGASNDKGQCFKNALCNVTKYSRYINGNSKLFMTWWSFGVSWLSENLTTNIVSKLESLQAIILGLGKANCKAIYKCEIHKNNI